MRYFHRKNKSPKSFQAFSRNFLKNYKLQSRWKLTSMWFEHATFWSGVRSAIVAPRSPVANWAVRFKDRVFFLPVFFCLSFECVYVSLNWRGFTKNKKIPIKFSRLFLIFLKKTSQILRLANIDFDVIRTRNLQRIEPYGYTVVFFFLPATIFCALKLLIYPWNEVLLLEKQIPKKFPGLFWNFIKNYYFLV